MKKLYIVMYHYTRDLAQSRYPAIKGLDSALFDEQLTFFEEHMHVVTMEEVLSAFDGKTNLPEDAVLLTFDDGYIDNYLTAFPLLMKHHMQGSFFIPGRTFTEKVVLDVNKIHFILATANIDVMIEDVRKAIESLRGGTAIFHHLRNYGVITQKQIDLMMRRLYL